MDYVATVVVFLLLALIWLNAKPETPLHWVVLVVVSVPIAIGAYLLLQWALPP